MATKKVAPKKAAKPAQKAPARPTAKSSTKATTSKGQMPLAKKNAKPAVAVSKKSAVKAVVKPVKSAAKPVAKPTLKLAQKNSPVTKKAVAPPPPKKQPLPVKSEPAKKPVVEAPTPQTVKAATKPLEAKPTQKEPAKPSKVLVPKTSTDKKIKYEPDFTRSVLDRSKHVENGPTMRYSDAELAEFRALINRKLDVAKKELAYLQGLITRKDESGDLDEGRYMTMEDGSMSMEREQLSQMASRQIQFIDHLEKAIMRIENKTYGICRVTGKLIDKARLRAVPHATLSIEAKQMMNK
ncbi:MAG TPA: TraR/DksA C4-type zinc finger protein [Flavisolibacter sp.]|jgi:RNA polymerase-binding transcription factor DksA|nr:TraR/DksA C4-type zinc finger protein [Flavisolibacter sp.]